jgi:hypothetical protein
MSPRHRIHVVLFLHTQLRELVVEVQLRVEVRVD